MCVCVAVGYWRHLQIPGPFLKFDALGGERTWEFPFSILASQEMLTRWQGPHFVNWCSVIFWVLSLTLLYLSLTIRFKWKISLGSWHSSIVFVSPNYVLVTIDYGGNIFIFLTTDYITSLCTGLSLSVWQILSQAGEMGWPFWPSSMPCGRTWLTWTVWGTDPAERICKRPSGSRNTSWRSPNCWSPKVESSSFLWKPPCFKVLHEVDLKQHLCEGDHSNVFSCWKI